MAALRIMIVFTGVIVTAIGLEMFHAARHIISQDRKGGLKMLFIAIILMPAGIVLCRQAVQLRTGQAEYQPQRQEVREYPDEVCQFEELEKTK